MHAVPLVFLTSAGQDWPVTPVHVSGTSHSPAATRQTVPLGATTSAGQLLFVPSQVSLRSHASPDPVPQTTVLGCTPSAGHAPLVPVQVSAASHAPTAARHSVPLALNVQLLVQHALAVPFAAPWSHCSPASRVPLPHDT